VRATPCCSRADTGQACTLKPTHSLPLLCCCSPTQAPPPSESSVREVVVRAAVTEQLVTRYTSAVGVMLQADPLDPYAVSYANELRAFST
jgi:hypothetical protein